MKNKILILFLAGLLSAFLPSCNSSKIKTLVITGPGTHYWPESAAVTKQILDETGLFSVKILNTPPTADDEALFNPRFSKYGLVVISYEGGPWNNSAKEALSEYLINGGGLVVLNSAVDLVINTADTLRVSDRSDLEIRIQPIEHPVTAGLPVRWVQPEDVIYKNIRPAGEDVQVLASAALDGQAGRGQRPSPVLLSKITGKGRIFALMFGTPAGENVKSVHSAGYITILQRAAEWAATGKVDQVVPSDFPTAAGPVVREGFSAIDESAAFENLKSYETGKSTKYYTWLQYQLQKANGNEEVLSAYEVKMVELLKDPVSTNDAKKLILRELSWMGTDYCVPAIRELAAVQELTDEVNFALERLK